ncbi:efflux RND transporter periplasmic adaptor subunit [Alteraurantiacibacter palmitatis]|uniref:Efflux RND transporter periplasmic adaptor subunit n=1 Tax=Alteraurantiacibacter palmitatis TaxID=2054628 RepID=A0ABV7EA75_9SPHN
MLSACAAEAEAPPRSPPLVSAEEVRQHSFADVIEAVGTANANEQVVIAANVTERVERVLFSDSMPVARGQLLAVLSQASEQALLDGAIAAEQQANSQYERINALFERGFATQAQLDQQLAAAQRARAQSEEARAAISDRMIRAPFAGYTGLRTISAGAVVQAGTPLVTVSDISRIKLDFPVPETLFARLAPGQAIEASAAAFPGQVFSGRISAIDPVIDLNSRAVMVRAVLPNPGARLKPGMLLTVRIRQSERMADAVPELAVIGQGDRRSVFVLDADNVARSVTVTTGLRDGGLVEVQGLPPGARVVTEGVLKVTDGMQVRVADGAAATQEAEAG